MNSKELQLSIAKLQRSAPRAFDEFRAAYQLYCTEVLREIISSPPESVQVAQGRAKFADEFLRLLNASLAVAEQIEKRTK